MHATPRENQRAGEDWGWHCVINILSSGAKNVSIFCSFCSLCLPFGPDLHFLCRPLNEKPSKLTCSPSSEAEQSLLWKFTAQPSPPPPHSKATRKPVSVSWLLKIQRYGIQPIAIPFYPLLQRHTGEEFSRVSQPFLSVIWNLTTLAWQKKHGQKQDMALESTSHLSYESTVLTELSLERGRRVVSQDQEICR